MNRAYPPLTFSHRPILLRLEERSAHREQCRHHLGGPKRTSPTERERGHFSHAGSMLAYRPHDAGTDDGCGGNRVGDRSLQVRLQGCERGVPRKRSARGDCCEGPDRPDKSDHSIGVSNRYCPFSPSSLFPFQALHFAYLLLIRRLQNVIALSLYLAAVWGSEYESIGRAVSVDTNQLLHAPSCSRADDECEQVYRLGNEFRLWRNSGFLYEAGKPRERGLRAVGVDRCHTAWVAGVPGFEQCKRLGAAYLADDYAVGTQSHGRPYQPRHVSGLGGVKLDEVLRAALDFEGVFDDHVSLVRIGTLHHFIDERARQR